LAIVAICFFCTCGHNLCVDDNWAGGSTRCLACGCLVRVPTIARSQQIQVVPPVPAVEIKVTEVPMLPRAPLPYRRPKPHDDDEVYQLLQEPEEPDGPDTLRKLERRRLRGVLAEAQRDLVRRRRRARTWPLETHWYQFLLYPLRAWRLVCSLALAWATLIAFLVSILPPDWTFWETVARLPLLLFVFLLAGYTCACLDATLAAAAEGEAGYIAKPNGDIMLRSARSGAQVVVCFLAGPIVPALVAFWFWVESGDFELVDWLIVWELGLVAIGYWVLALLSVQQSRRWRDANPVAIVKLVKRLGYRPVVAAALVSITVVGYGLLMFDALEELHRSLGGWLLMTWYWGGQLFLLLLLLRWLGVSIFRARMNDRL
jgi:hypothetical protein